VAECLWMNPRRRASELDLPGSPLCLVLDLAAQPSISPGGPGGRARAGRAYRLSLLRLCRRDLASSRQALRVPGAGQAALALAAEI